MVDYKYAVSDEQGFHATNAANLCRAASDHESSVILKGERKSAGCKNVLALMSLDAHQGEYLELSMEGPDKDQTAGFLQGLMCTIL